MKSCPVTYGYTVLFIFLIFLSSDTQCIFYQLLCPQLHYKFTTQWKDPLIIGQAILLGLGFLGVIPLIWKAIAFKKHQQTCISMLTEQRSTSRASTTSDGMVDVDLTSTDESGAPLMRGIVNPHYQPGTSTTQAIVHTPEQTVRFAKCPAASSV